MPSNRAPSKKCTVKSLSFNNRIKCMGAEQTHSAISKTWCNWITRLYRSVSRTSCRSRKTSRRLNTQLSYSSFRPPFLTSPPKKEQSNLWTTLRIKVKICLWLIKSSSKTADSSNLSSSNWLNSALKNYKTLRVVVWAKMERPRVEHTSRQ